MGGAAGWGALAQGISDIGQTEAANYRMIWAAKRARENYRHRYQWAVKDMRKAGVNPILGLAGAGPGTAPSAVPTSSQAGSGMGAAVDRDLRRRGELAKVRAEEERATSAKDLNYQQRNLMGQQQATEEWRSHYQMHLARQAEINTELAEWGAHSARVVGAWDRTPTGEKAAITRRAAETFGAAARPVAEALRGMSPFQGATRGVGPRRGFRR